MSCGVRSVYELVAMSSITSRYISYVSSKNELSSAYRKDILRVTQQGQRIL